MHITIATAVGLGWLGRIPFIRLLSDVWRKCSRGLVVVKGYFTW